MYAVLYLTVEWLKTLNEKDGLVHLYSHQRLLHHMQLGDFDTSLFFMKGSNDQILTTNEKMSPP